MRRLLEEHYRAWNRRRFVHPDPVETLYAFPDPREQEIVGLVASALAYGRVVQILASIRNVLDVLGPSPRAFLLGTSDRVIVRRLAPFRHRFTTGAEMAAFLVAVKRALQRHGSLERLFAAGLSPADATVLSALSGFVEGLRRLSPRPCASLLSSPEDGSACKRLNLYLRWMVRRDSVDPGPWRSVHARKLVVPLDTHLFRIGRALGLTARRQADLKAAIEITQGFARYSPHDPVRYDFSLTRLGIRADCHGTQLSELLRRSMPPRLTSW